MDIADFLLARIAEDEAVARRLADGEHHPEWRVHEGLGVVDGYDTVVLYREEDEYPPHVARWDPARVLAECEAKRRIVGLHSITDSGDCPACDQQYETLRLLALPYADHPDFREEWKP